MLNLSPRELKFIECYNSTRDPKKSAIEAGYSPKNANSAGNRLLHKDKIQSRLKELSERPQSEHGITRESMIESLQQVILNAKTEEYPNYPAMLKAMELQAKILGFFEPEQQRVNNYNILISNQQNKQAEEIPILELE